MNAAQTPSEPAATLKPTRLTLRSLLAGIAFVAILLACTRSFGAGPTLAVLFGLAIILAHVAGNAIGTHLHKQQLIALRSARPAPPVSMSHRVEAVPAELSLHRPLHRCVWIFTAAGALLGACVGGSALAWLNWQRATFWNISFGTVSAGVLGAFWGFWLNSLYQVVKAAWKQALQDPDRDSAS